MKTIEERAIEYVDSQGAGSVHPYNRQAMIDAYIAAWEELTRWNDPKEQLPSLLTRVLGRSSDGKNISVNIVYRRLTATGRNWFWTDGVNAPLDIDGWREIH